MMRSNILLIEHYSGGTEADGVFILIIVVCYQSINVAILLTPLAARKLYRCENKLTQALVKAQEVDGA